MQSVSSRHIHNNPDPHDPDDEDNENFGLDDRSVRELKEKAIAAKGRAYCKSCRSFFYLFVFGFIFVFVFVFGFGFGFCVVLCLF